MNEDDFTQLGLATNFAITENEEVSGTLRLAFHSAEYGKVTYLITPGMARFLWFNLTQILFPRAADQLTSRAPTIALTTPSSLSVLFTAKVWARDDGLIEVIAMSLVSGWNMRLTPEEGHELWACLEKVLGIVGGNAA